MRDFILILKALANPVRDRIMKLLENGELCVCDIIEVIGLKQSTVSKHLNILKIAGLVEDRRDGTWAFYKISNNKMNEYNLFMNEMMRQVLNEDDCIFRDKRRFDEKKCCGRK